MTIVSKPPRDKSSRLYRKWEESLVRAAEDTTPLTNVPFVTLGNSSALTNERALSGSDNIELTDGGPGSGVTLDLSDTGVSAGSYDYASVAVDAKGRITGISAGDPNAYIPEYLNTDPSSPSAGDVWVKHSYSAAGGGTLTGMMGITDSGTLTDTYELSYRTSAATTKRVTLS